MVGASKLKNEIGNIKSSLFDNNIVKYNTWFEGTRDVIIKEEGLRYNEYLRPIFRDYSSYEDDEFLDATKDERKKLIQGKFPTKYTCLNLMELGKVTFNTLIGEGLWRIIPKPKE